MLLTRFLLFLSGRSIHPFCNKVKRDPLQTECTDDRSSVALCNLIEYPQPLPKQYQVSGEKNVAKSMLKYIDLAVFSISDCDFRCRYIWNYYCFIPKKKRIKHKNEVELERILRLFERLK